MASRSRVTLASVVIALGFGLGAALAAGVLRGGDLSRFDLARYDAVVAAAVIAYRFDSLTVVARTVTLIGSAWVLVPLTLLTVAILAIRRRWLACAAVATGMTISLVFTIVLKVWIGRVRPDDSDVLGAISTGFAFPSGHTLNATVYLGLLVVLMALATRRPWLRAVVIGAGVVLAAGVGVSRIYLGYHWFTDVLAGWAIGVGVLGFVLLVTAVRARVGIPLTVAVMVLAGLGWVGRPEALPVEAPPVGAKADYQIGGDYDLINGTETVSRDWFEGEPAEGAYWICYVNAFQTQPDNRGVRRLDETSAWPGDRVLSGLADDPKWTGEYLIDISTPEKRRSAAGWVEQMVSVMTPWPSPRGSPTEPMAKV